MGTRFSRTVLAAVMAVFVIASSVRAWAQPVFSTEYDIKAALLFNLAQFAEWSSNAFENAQSPIVIGVVGANPFGDSLDKALAGEKVQNRPIVAIYFRRGEEIRNCHMLFVSRSESDRLESLFRRVRGRSILTVSDIDQFARRGGMVGLNTEKGKVRLVINTDELAEGNLRVSSKLLRIADRIGK